MKPRLLFASIVTLFISINMQSQDIDLKKEDVIIDGKATFKFERKRSATEFSLFKMDKSEEIIFIQRNNNETISYINDDFVQITFIKENRKLETSRLKGNSFKSTVELLLKDKVLDLEGNIDTNKLDTFFTKYDEKITQRTVRY